MIYIDTFNLRENLKDAFTNRIEEFFTNYDENVKFNLLSIPSFEIGDIGYEYGCRGVKIFDSQDVKAAIQDVLLTTFKAKPKMFEDFLWDLDPSNNELYLCGEANKPLGIVEYMDEESETNCFSFSIFKGINDGLTIPFIHLQLPKENNCLEKALAISEKPEDFSLVARADAVCFLAEVNNSETLRQIFWSVFNDANTDVKALNVSSHILHMFGVVNPSDAASFSYSIAKNVIEFIDRKDVLTKDEMRSCFNCVYSAFKDIEEPNENFPLMAFYSISAEKKSLFIDMLLELYDLEKANKEYELKVLSPFMPPDLCAFSIKVFYNLFKIHKYIDSYSKIEKFLLENVSISNIGVFSPYLKESTLHLADLRFWELEETLTKKLNSILDF